MGSVGDAEIIIDEKCCTKSYFRFDDLLSKR